MYNLYCNRLTENLEIHLDLVVVRLVILQSLAHEGVLYSTKGILRIV